MQHIICFISYVTYHTYYQNRYFAVICQMIMSISWADRASRQNKSKIFDAKNKACTVHGLSQGRPNTEKLVFAVWLFRLLYRRLVMIFLKSFSPEIKIGTHKKAILAEFKFIKFIPEVSQNGMIVFQQIVCAQTTFGNVFACWCHWEAIASCAQCTVKSHIVFVTQEWLNNFYVSITFSQ